MTLMEKDQQRNFVPEDRYLSRERKRNVGLPEHMQFWLKINKNPSCSYVLKQKGCVPHILIPQDYSQTSRPSVFSTVNQVM